MGLPDYAELDCLSNFTFLTGASHPEELVRTAAELGYRAIALADECSLAGIVRAWREARRHGLHLIAGSRFRPEGEAFELIVLAEDRDGYGALSRLITRARRRSPKGRYAFALEDLWTGGDPGDPGEPGKSDGHGDPGDLGDPSDLGDPGEFGAPAAPLPGHPARRRCRRASGWRRR